MDAYTREEQFLNGIANKTEVPEPYTREEQFLKNVADAVAQGGGGGAEELVVEFAITPGETFTVTSETTFAEIYAAYQQGKNIRGVGAVTGMFDLVFSLTQISETDVVFFCFIEVTEGGGIMATIRGNSSGYSMYQYH